MPKEPAFLFYDGDAARDVSHMNRLERGCYFDLIQAQRKFGSYTTVQARKILGKDFDTCWGAIELILSVEKAENGENDKYFIEWVREATNKRTEYIETQRSRIQNYWDEKKKTSSPTKYIGISTDIPLENEDEDVIKKGGVGGEKTLQINAPITLSMFDQFWEIYPKKVDKGKALNNWKKICNKKTNERPVWKEIKRAILLQRKSERWQDKQFIPHPATWLNQNRWLDDPKEMKNIIRESNTPKIKYIDNIKCIWNEKTQHYHHAISNEVIFE